jgi:hypothetical protein
MSWIRRGARGGEPAGQRLPDLEFLALVRASLEREAPGVTRGAELKGNSLHSPQGWAVGVARLHPGSDLHYDLLAVPDWRIQPEVPMFADCAVAMNGDPRSAADSWVQTAGMCLLELLDRRGRFAAHFGPDDEYGVPGFHMIASGATAFGVELAENQRLQKSLLDANVLHRVAWTFTGDLESPWFNGVKVFYGGQPGDMQAEVRVNGDCHDGASSAMSALGIPEPSAFAASRFYALLLPVTGDGQPQYPATTLEVDDELAQGCGHDGTCGCGAELDPEHPGFAVSLPHLIAELPPEERERRVRVQTDAVIVAAGVGNFLKVRLPVQLDDGRTVVYLVWIYLEAEVISEVCRRAREDSLAGHRFRGLLGNAVEPWGDQLLRAPVTLEGRPATSPDGVGICEVVQTKHKLLGEVLRNRWPAAMVLGDRDPRLRASQ